MLKDYLHEIGQYPLLSEDEEKILTLKAADGDKRARQKLIESNLRLVVGVAKRYNNQHLSLMDLISAGNIGLITAIDKYDPNQPYRLSTYAIPWIRSSITKAITDCGRNIRLPGHVFQQVSLYRKVMREFEVEGIKPTDEMIAEKMGIKVEKIAPLRELLVDTLSLDTPLGDDSEDTLGDLQEDTKVETPVEFVNRLETRDLIIEILHRLSDRSRAIVKMRFGIAEEGDDEFYNSEHSLEEIGVRLGLSRERVRQLLNESLFIIKENYTRKV